MARDEREEIEKSIVELIDAIERDRPEIAKVLAISIVGGIVFDINRIANALEKLAEAGLTLG